MQDDETFREGARAVAELSKTPGKTLLIDDLSRLSHDDIELKQTIRRFRYWGIRIVGVSDCFDSDSKGYKVHAGMRGL